MRYVLVIAVLPLAAHTVSISTGSLTVSASNATYRLTMPAYELQHFDDARSALPEAVSIEGATRAGSSCSADSTSMTCTIEWRFGAPAEAVTVTSRLAGITVPNHIHILTAVRDGLHDRAVLDENSPSAVLRFREQGPLERVLTDRPVSALAIALACLTAGIAARSRRDLTGSCAAFGAGLGTGALVASPLPVSFLETAIAVSCAYMSFEALALPEAAWRSFMPALPGIALGLYLHNLSPGNTAMLVVGAAAISIPLALAGVASKRVLPGVVLLLSALWTVAALTL